MTHDVTGVAIIGRNTDNVPMHGGDWISFRSDLLTAIRQNGGIEFARPDEKYHSGHFGRYDNQFEDAAFVAFTIRSDRLPLLRHNLAVLAHDYGQEAIGLIVQGKPDTPDTLVFAEDRLGPIE